MRIYGESSHVAALGVDLDGRPGHPIDVLPSVSSLLVSDHRPVDNPTGDFLLTNCPIRDCVAIRKVGALRPRYLDASTTNVKRQQP